LKADSLASAPPQVKNTAAMFGYERLTILVASSTAGMFE
jgi:hypothetical protein